MAQTFSVSIDSPVAGGRLSRPDLGFTTLSKNAAAVSCDLAAPGLTVPAFRFLAWSGVPGH